MNGLDGEELDGPMQVHRAFPSQPIAKQSPEGRDTRAPAGTAEHDGEQNGAL